MDQIFRMCYKLNLQAPTMRNASKEALFDINEQWKEIHKKLHKTLNIKVDKVGTRQRYFKHKKYEPFFFRNYKKTNITRIEDLIRKFYIILILYYINIILIIALSSDHEVNSDQFNKFTHEIAKLYVKYMYYMWIICTIDIECL